MTTSLGSRIWAMQTSLQGCGTRVHAQFKGVLRLTKVLAIDNCLQENPKATLRGFPPIL